MYKDTMYKGSIEKLLYCGLISLVLIFSSACAHYAVDDKPLAQWSTERNKDLQQLVADNRSSELLVLVAFSGGGTRAASFAYGVLLELAETEVITAKGNRSLLHEIDAISSVSGGSFTSAYYGLYGDRIFEDFETRFLRQDVQSKLLWQLARPGWPAASTARRTWLPNTMTGSSLTTRLFRTCCGPTLRRL